MEEIVPPVLVFFASMIVTVDLTNIAVQGYVSLDLVHQRDLVLVQVILIVDMLMEKNAYAEHVKIQDAVVPLYMNVLQDMNVLTNVVKDVQFLGNKCNQKLAQLSFSAAKATLEIVLVLNPAKIRSYHQTSCYSLMCLLVL